MTEPPERAIDRIEQALVRKGWSWRQLAEATGLPATRFARWKGTDDWPGVGEPALSEAVKIADALGMTLEELAGRPQQPGH